jgi:hypothetical protein
MLEFVVKRAGSILIGAVVAVSWVNSSLAQQPATQDSTVTLFSVKKHRGEPRNFCFNFHGGPSTFLQAHCDLKYGLLYAGDELDWFESASAKGDRSVIRDLGDYSWTAIFEIPVVEPLPELKPGERRQVSIDVSGADGADGAPGKLGASAASIVRGSRERSTSSLLPSNDGPVPGDISPTVLTAEPRAKPSPLKHDGKPKIDSLFVKAIAGHMYVIHVVDDSRNFYALFRVEALERGDYCTISWKLIPDPLP